MLHYTFYTQRIRKYIFFVDESPRCCININDGCNDEYQRDVSSYKNDLVYILNDLVDFINMVTTYRITTDDYGGYEVDIELNEPITELLIKRVERVLLKHEVLCKLKYT